MTENGGVSLIRNYKTFIILLFQFVAVATIALILSCLILPNVTPMHQGYICDDPSLNYKYHPNTIEISVVHLTGYFLLIMTIFLVECRPLATLNVVKVCASDKSSLNERFLNSCYAFFASQLGLSMNFALVQLIKHFCGRLRPHFFDVCRPTIDCRSGTYVDSYVCTGTNTRLIRDAHLSFYSGHASAAFYYATFLTVYTHMRLHQKLLHCLPLLYISHVCLFAAASFVGLSRIADNKHHYSDVAFGALAGIIIGVTVVFAYLQEVLRRTRVEPYTASESVVTLERRRFQNGQINEGSA